MNIDEFRLVVKARDFDVTCKFYGEVIALPRLRAWEHESGRSALFQAGAGLIEVRGRAPSTGGRPERDEAFDYQGPAQKTTITLLTNSAEKAYEDLIFRHKNIPGGLRELADGTVAFETADPDGLKILIREPYRES